MKALILAAGFGTRLRPFTYTMPKTLVPVNNIPLILYILAFIKHNSIKDVVINLHHLGHKIQKFLGNGSKFGMHIHYSHEPKILGTGGGIKKALRYIDEQALIINGDVVVDFNLKAFIKQHNEQKPYATLALYHHKNSKKYGLLHYKNKQLLSIINKPRPPKKSKSAMFGSFHLLSKEQSWKDFQKIKNKKQFCILHDIYVPQLVSGKNFGSYSIKGFWHVCDSMRDIKQTEKNLNRKGFKLSYQKELNWMWSKVENN